MQLLALIFFAVVGIQILYFITFIVALSKKQQTKETAPLPVSVIVCAHDEESNLKELIPALLAQDYATFEVIIVDDRSNDGTFDMLLADTAKDHRLRMVHVNRTPPHTDSKKYALTLGIKAARYEWLLLTDADCRPLSTKWISTMSAQFSDNTNFVLGYSPYNKAPGFLNSFIRFETLLTAIQYISFALMGYPYMGVGRNLAHRRSRFLEAKGFNNIISVAGGDDDLYVNQHATGSNTAVCVSREAQMQSIPKTTWKSFFGQKIRHLSVGKRYRWSNRITLGMFTITWMITWFLGIPLAIFSENYYVFIGLLVIRIILITVTVQGAAKKLGEKFDVLMILPLDFIYAFYYLVTGLRALVTKKVRWKN